MRYKTIAIIMALCCSSSALNAAKDPVLLETKFANDIPTDLDLKEYSQKCAVHIGNLSDMRSDKKVIGVFEKRAIISPEDNMIWMDSIVAGFASRNIELVDADDAMVSTDLHLIKAWISNTHINISANIVFKMQMADETEVLYRGNNSRTTFWSGGGNKMQKALDVSIANALDKMAISLHDACNKNKPSGNLAENIIEI